MSGGVHIQVQGRGPPLVLLHGWAMHGGVFGDWLARLAERHTVHVVDLPGHGHSRHATVPLHLEAVVATVLAQVPQPAQWCGWSLGGLFALHAALQHPQRVTQLVMLCATPCFVRRPDWPHAVAGEVFDGFAQGLQADEAGTLQRFVALQAAGSAQPREETRRLRQALLARDPPSAAALAQGLALLQHTDLRAALPQLPMPSLWLAGAGDLLAPPQALAMAAALAPHARHAVIEHAGHAPFLMHAEALMRHWRDNGA